MAHDIIVSGPFVLMRYHNDTLERFISGGLTHKPKLYVLVGNEEQDRVETHPISWAAAQVLALNDMIVLAEELRRVRRRDEALYEKTLGVQTCDAAAGVCSTADSHKVDN